MTVQNPIVKNVYRGNGSTTVFPYTFALNDTDGQYVKVLIADENDIETAVENFSVDTEAKTVTYPTSGEPLPEGYKIVLRRALPYTQELNLENQGPFFADDIEAELDRIVMQVQQQAEQLERAVKVQASSDITADELLADIYAKHADTVASAQAAAEYSANADAKAEAAEASKIAAAKSEANAAASQASAAADAAIATEKRQAIEEAQAACATSALAAAASEANAAASEAVAVAKSAIAEASASAAATSETNAAASAGTAQAAQASASAAATAAAASAAEAAAIVDPQMVDRKIAEHNTSADAHPDGLKNPLRVWSAGTTYNATAVVVQDKKIWMCTTPNSDAEFDKAKWENIGGGGGLPLGFIFWTSAPVEMEGVLVADGATISRAMYPDYNKQQAKLNYPWGAGDGSTTFNLPNLIGRFAEGAENAGGYHSAGLPNITGDITNNSYAASTQFLSDALPTSNGALSIDNTYVTKNAYDGTYNITSPASIDFNASRSNPIYGSSNTVQPPSALLIPYVVVFTEQTAEPALIDVTQYAQELANKVNRSEADYVVDSYHDADGNWWRKYKSGWIEQGGISTESASPTDYKNFIIPFTTKVCYLAVQQVASISNPSYVNWINNKDVPNPLANFTCGVGNDVVVGSDSLGVWWEAKGW